MPTPRMRTIKGAVAYLKEQDPGSEITEYYIRRLVKTGEIPSLPVGCKRLVNVDLLIERLCERQGYTMIEIGQPDKLSMTINLEELIRKYQEHQDAKAKWNHLYGGGAE